jgi:signal transduction histidine kinase
VWRGYQEEGAFERTRREHAAIHRALIAHDPEAAATLLELTAEHLDRGLHEVRELASGIHPAQLAAGGLGPAVTSLQKHVPLPVEVVDELHDRLPNEVETALYFSCAEAIANAVKHSEATAIKVRLGYNGGRAFLEVVDDGKGGASLEHGSGLRGLSDRVAVLSGTVDVASPPGNGTRLLVEIPANG